MLFIPAGGSAFEDSQDYIEKACLEKQTNSRSPEYIGSLGVMGESRRGKEERGTEKMCGSIKTTHTHNTKTKTVNVRTCVRTGL